LAHVVRFPEEEEGISSKFFEQLQEEAQAEIMPHFEKIIQSLTGMGVNPNKVRTKVITGVVSRYTALLNEARNGRYGTIVIGRKGISEVEEFEMGQVGSKIVQAARDMAVWVVS
jgi:nucleotide-binding universal stress UspA family protein